MKTEYLVNIGSVILGAFLGVGGLYLYDNYRNATQHVDYRLNTSSNILEKVVPQVTMQVGDKPVSSIGLIDFEIYNQTNKDLDSLPVTILLRSKTGGRIGQRMVSQSYVDVNGQTERVKLLEIDSMAGTLIRITYSIAPFNRSDEAVLKGSVVVTNIEEIDPSIEIKRTGIEPRILKQSVDDLILGLPRIVLVIGAMLYVLTIVFLLMLIRYRADLLRNKEQSMRLRLKLSRAQSDINAMKDELEKHQKT